MPHTIKELDALWSARNPSPRGRGTVVQVCVRPDVARRAFPDTLELCPKRGAIGDRWERRTWMHLPDGSPDPRVQLALMNSRMLAFLQTLTGSKHHPGDTLLVDLNLEAAVLPIGARLAVGTAVIEVSDVENDGCAKFAKHFGSDVLEWIRADENRPKRHRGLFARVVSEGQVRPGDSVEHIGST